MADEKKTEGYILIADDQPDIGFALKVLFESSGYRVKVVENGKLALDEVRKEHPLLVISDILMPQMNGFKLCEMIKQDGRTADIPVILLTAVYRKEHHVDMGFSHGADAYFSKPFKPDQILQVAKKLISGRGA
jgi:CheY-like chemotaxis protein